MIAVIKNKNLSPSANSRDTTNADLGKSPDEILDETIKEHFIKNPKELIDFEKTAQEESKRKRKKYKARRWRGHSYGINLLKTVAYHHQAYYFAYGIYGKTVRPSRKRLAKEIGICLETLDKAHRLLRKMEVLNWESGKKTWETNIYHLAPCYLTTPMRHPGNDYRHPRHLFFKLHANRKIKGFKKIGRAIYEHLLRDIRHHIFQISKKIRSFEKKVLSKLLNEALNPKKARGPPILRHLLKSFSFSFKDKAILSSYCEGPLRASIDDLNAFKSWKKEVKNEVAFLISRCKAHKKALEEKQESYKDCTPDEALGWIKAYLTSRKDKLTFISTLKEIDRSAKVKKPQVLLRINKDSATRSIFGIFHKVEGTWIDKEFTFNRPDFKRVVFDYFEGIFKPKFKKAHC